MDVEGTVPELGARVMVSMRRVVVHLPQSFPFLAAFRPDRHRAGSIAGIGDDAEPEINENESMRDVWFTADFHFGHFNIIQYCNRPFANSQEMDDVICERVNACAKPSDVLYFLGDFCLGGPERVFAYRKRLACRTIHFIEGNHDRTARSFSISLLHGICCPKST